MKSIITRMWRWFAVMVAVVVTMTTVSAAPVWALTESQLNMFSQNNIVFYDPSCSKLVSYDGNVTVGGGLMAEKVWSGLTSFLTPEQAAGAMGNMAHEGLMNPVLHEEVFRGTNYDIFTDNTVSYGVGLIQWSWGRRVSMLESVLANNPELKQYFTGHSYNFGFTDGDKFLKELTEEIGEEAADSVANALVALELSVLKTEINKSWSDFYEITSVEEAARYFLYNVEKPNNMASKLPERTSDALRYYEMYADSEFETGATLKNSAGKSCATSVGLTDGGYANVADAESALITAYKDDDLSGLSLIMPDTLDKHDNCVAFVTWFISRMTSIELPQGSIGGNGDMIAENFYNGWSGKYPDLTISNTPSVYSVASWKVAGEFTSTGMHTGIIVGIDQARDKILVAEAGWNNHSFTGVHEHSLSAATNNPYYYYVNINAYINSNVGK